jgi:hypothetical protein
MLNPDKFNPVASLKALVEAAYHNPKTPFIFVETPHKVVEGNDEEWVVRYCPAEDGGFGDFYTDGFDCLGGEVNVEQELLIEAEDIDADYLVAPNGAALPVRDGEVYGLVGSRVKVMTGNPAARRSQEQQARVAAALMSMYTHNTVAGKTVKVARIGECFADLKIESTTL